MKIPGKAEAIIHRWSFLISVLIIGGFFSFLSENITIGPSWIVLAVVVILILPLLSAVILGRHHWTRRLAFTITTILTIGLVNNVIFLVNSLFHHTETGSFNLFRDALLLWSSNVVLFAVWYWEVDQGGPIRRFIDQPEPPDLLFPQLANQIEGWQSWKPGFIDYLFLAFNTSTAFSPTDTVILSKRAKYLMMTQSSLSLVIIAVLAARAINMA